MCNHHEKYMQEAINLSIDNIDDQGGPFGAVIVKNSEIIARGVNRVTSSIDPTAHAEVNAIRQAAKVLGSFDLSGCTIYSSCEPCPMCLGAIFWARLDNLYFANSKQDAKEIDFDDSFIYEQLDKPMEQRSLPTKQIMREQALMAFKKWQTKTDKIEY